MKRFVILGLALPLTLGVCLADVRSEIEGQYKKWAKAAMANDVDSVLTILAPDYVLVTYTGDKIQYEAYVASLRKRKADKLPAQKYTTKLIKLTPMDGEVEVTSEETSLTLKPKPLKHIHRYRDTWIKSASGWLLRRTFTESERNEPVTQQRNPTKR